MSNENSFFSKSDGTLQSLHIKFTYTFLIDKSSCYSRQAVTQISELHVSDSAKVHVFIILLNKTDKNPGFLSKTLWTNFNFLNMMT